MLSLRLYRGEYMALGLGFAISVEPRVLFMFYIMISYPLEATKYTHRKKITSDIRPLFMN